MPHKVIICVIIGLIFDMGMSTSDAQPTCPVNHTQNTKTVPLFEVFEITFQHEGRYPNPFFDVTIEVDFNSPTGKRFHVGGFHYGSSVGARITTHKVKTPHGEALRAEYTFDKQDLWKARFAPTELGEWTYSYLFTNIRGDKATGQGTFRCVKGRRPNPGFVRQNPENPFRWIFDDGSTYFPIGLQNGWGDNFGTGSFLSQCCMEGPFRLDRQGRSEPPPGAMFKPGPSNNPQNADVYFRHYGRCGFNLFRFSQKNCTPPLYQDLDHYLIQEAIMTDELLRCARKYGFKIFYGLFGYQPVYTDRPEDSEAMAKVKRFVKYSVDRWAAYVDFWEFLNEQKADRRWYEIMAPYLRLIDPYKHPITTSWERPELDVIEFNAPHWYQNENELRSDAETEHRARQWKKYGKPVIVGEQGNAADRDLMKRPPAVGGVWDPRSALRMRIRNWTALFNEIAFIFWNTSYAKDGHYMNIWLGPLERQYVRAMQDFAYCLDSKIRMVSVEVSDPMEVRAYGLASKRCAAAYLHHFANHERPVKGLTVRLDVPRSSKAYWYSPENGAMLRTTSVSAGRQSLLAPPFTVDIALLITPDVPPDSDHDGKPNDLDPDDDNDEVPDEKDAFPLDPEEWADKDGDLIGDNMDADDDADGIGDDQNKNGIPDCEELDFDGDGVPRAKSVPWDAFPLDPQEWRDTDGDGVGDNADEDDDGDGWPDAAEKQAGTDPLNKLDFPVP